MTAKELLLELLKKQKKEAWRSGDWDKLDPTIDVDEEGYTKITLDSVYVGFLFDKNGRFLGIFNWQD